MKDVIATVNSVELINHNVYEVTLQVGSTQFIAGQYLMICLPSGEKVPYSIGSAPDTLPTLTLYILVTEPSSLAHKVIEYLYNNDQIDIKIPGGDAHIECKAFQQDISEQHPPSEQQAKHILLIAGGTGFAQMKSIYDRLAHNNYQGHVSFYWGVRTPDDIFMEEWIRQVQAEHTFTLDVVVNDGDESWQGRTGWLYEAVLADHPDLSNSIAFISGSVNMVYGTLDQLELKGLKADQCFSDVFAYAAHPNKPTL